MNQNEIITKVKQHGQEHVLRFFDELNDASRQQLLNQLAEIDWDKFDALVNEYVLKKPDMPIPGDLQPPGYYPLQPEDEAQGKFYEKAKARGCELLRHGKVAALTVAGGQGTRLGFDGPKGTYPITPVKHKTLFEYFAQSLLRIGEKYGVMPHWFIMTSKLNDQPTKDFFAENKFFGLPQEKVSFFSQGMMGAFDFNGKLLMAARDSLALAPNGHGGTLLALRKSGALERMKEEGAECISYFQIDNPLVTIANELFIGLHNLENSQMSAIMLAKTGPYEKLGNFCVSKGRTMIIEYSDIPDELAEARDENGKLKFIAGSPAIHLLQRTFVEQLTAGGSLQLPWHRADKRISYINESGDEVVPTGPSGVKLETFIFDALPLAEKTILLEADRSEEFAPTKNKTGVDSVESCRVMLIERDARWLEAAGVKIPRDGKGVSKVTVELSPRKFIDIEDVKAHFKGKNLDLSAKTQVYFD